MGDRFGEVSERFKEPVLKTGDGETHREFESHTLRQKETTIPARELSFLFVLFSSNRLRIRERSKKRIDTDSVLTNHEFPSMLFSAWGMPVSPGNYRKEREIPHESFKRIPTARRVQRHRRCSGRHCHDSGLCVHRPRKPS